MKTKKLSYVLLTALLAIVTAFAGVITVACGKKTETPTAEAVEGPETGVYYYDAGYDEFLIALNNVNKFSFSVQGANKSGEYTLDGEKLTFTFSGESETLTASLSGDVLTLTYDGAELRFLRKKTFTVTFDSNGGSAVSAVSVINGKTISKPDDPKLSGSVFIGWFTDSSYSTPFMFGTQILTSDITLYAQWAKKVDGQSEYVINFDLGYENAEAVASTTTIGGKLYNVTTPTRDGYEFAGWWVSAYDDASKLTSLWTSDTVFDASTTLYAVWKSTTTSSKLSAPLARVDSTSVKWDGVLGANTYRLEVTGPDGFTAIDERLGATSRAIDFSNAPAGDYVIKVTAIASSSANNSETTVRYYNNKALAKVSNFSVVEPSTLIFNEVENAERYLITIECGDSEHDHTNFDNGNSTNFNFSNCAMKEGGIKFTVTAVADGYASSVSSTFVYNRVLAQVEGFKLDESTQTLSWNAVANATNYVVSIKCGNASHDHSYVDNGSKTSYSLKECYGDIVVNVYPATKGYNSPVASTYTYNKTNLATPSNIRVVGNTLSWDAVDGATSYEIRLGSSVLTSKEASFDLTNATTWVTAQDYRLYVRAIGAQNSAWSDALDVRYYAMASKLSYSANTVSWKYVVGAEKYEVKVNDGNVLTVEDGSNFAVITLTKGGVNTVSVRFYGDREYSDWATIEVYAYTISFDSRAGAGVASQYAAYGDSIELPTTTREGYDFAGWYNTPGGAASNGAQYSDKKFTEIGDIMLYAYWTPKSYTVTYDYTDGAGNDGSAKVTYGMGYTLEVPTTIDGTLAFAGWYAARNGLGVQYTDSYGESLNDWSYTDDITVYAKWIVVLKYTLLNDGTYSVTKGTNATLATEIVVPVSYQGIAVTVVDGYAFRSCTKLVKVSIPDTVTLIETGTAFSSCSALEEVEIYHVDGNRDIVYKSVDGVLLYDNQLTGAMEIKYYPVAKKGAFEIPSGVTTIPIKAFSGSYITKVTIPATVTSIEQNAFLNCKQLTKVVFEQGGTSELTIASKVFQGCTALTYIDIPARTQEFSTDIFTSCSALLTDLLQSSVL